MNMLLLAAAASAIALAAPALAQTMDHSSMPGMKMPAQPTPKAKAKAKAAPETRPVGRSAARPAAKAAANPSAPRPGAEDPACPPEHAKMGHCSPSTSAMPPANQHVGGAQDPAPKPADPDCPPEHAAMGHCTPKAIATPPSGDALSSVMGTGGSALPAGDAPAPAPPEPNYADRIWGRDAMIGARGDLRREHGGGTFSQIMFNLAEYQVRDGRDGFRWDGEGWFGGDINRLVIRTEGEGSFGGGIEDAEVQALYSRAIGPYFNLQAGIRYDISPNPSRAYATVGFEGLAPYWFDVEGALFLSDKGDLLGRLEGYYDQRITQRLILQPRAELNLAAQDVPEIGIGSGVSDIEVGLRLRYEIKREFAPYIGISYDRKLGDTARFARAEGDDLGGASLVLGVRSWF